MNTKLYLVVSGIFGGVIGSLITALLVSPVTAQKDKFGDIECTSLRVVDENGVAQVILSTSLLSMGDTEGVWIGNDIFGGRVVVADSDGKLNVSLGVIEHGGRVNVYGNDGITKVQLNVDEHGGSVDVYDKDGKESPVTAQRNKFGDIECTSLKVVDEAGKVRVKLHDYGVDCFRGNGDLGLSLVNFSNGGHIDLYGANGKRAVSLDSIADGAHSIGGFIFIYDQNGERKVLLGDHKNGNGVAVWNAAVRVYGKYFGTVAELGDAEHGGFVRVVGKDFTSRAQLGFSEHGGHVQVKGKGEGAAVMGINEFGNGTVSTWDKNGYRQ